MDFAQVIKVMEYIDSFPWVYKLYSYYPMVDSLFIESGLPLLLDLYRVFSISLSVIKCTMYHSLPKIDFFSTNCDKGY